jgi:hypothetical protein
MTAKSAVGAVYDRALFPESTKYARSFLRLRAIVLTVRGPRLGSNSSYKKWNLAEKVC